MKDSNPINADGAPTLPEIVEYLSVKTVLQVFHSGFVLVVQADSKAAYDSVDWLAQLCRPMAETE